MAAPHRRPIALHRRLSAPHRRLVAPKKSGPSGPRCDALFLGPSGPVRGQINHACVTKAAERILNRAYHARMNRTFFVTTVTHQRQAIFLQGARAELLIDVILSYRSQGKYLLHDFVVMPDHVHLLLTPSQPVSLERAVQFIKGRFSFRLHVTWPLWQASFTYHRIQDVADFVRHRRYVWNNPVAAGLAANPEDYLYSSATGRWSVDAAPGLKPLPAGALTPA